MEVERKLNEVAKHDHQSVGTVVGVTRQKSGEKERQKAHSRFVVTVEASNGEELTQ
jgi:hypothetical protein